MINAIESFRRFTAVEEPAIVLLNTKTCSAFLTRESGGVLCSLPDGNGPTQLVLASSDSPKSPYYNANGWFDGSMRITVHLEVY